MQKFCVLLLVFLLTANVFGQDIRSDWKIKMPKAPTSKPYQIPKAPFTVPSWDELMKMEWQEGWVADLRDLAAKRAREPQFQTDKTADWVMKQKNDPTKKNNDAINKDMLAVLCQPPKSDAEVDWDATFKLRIVAPKVLNYILYSSTYESRICGLIYAGLFSFDHRLVPLADGDFAKKWLKHKNGLYDIVILRDDLTWEDGTPWTAYDIEFSYHMIMKESIPVPAMRSGTDQLKWVKAYGPNKIVFFHHEPLVTNQWNINFAVLPKHIYECSIMEDKTMVDSDWHNYWNRYPLSSGPYKLIEHETGSHVLLERRKEYYTDKDGKQIRSKPYMKYFRFKIIDEDNVALIEMTRGNIDEMRLIPRHFMRQTSGDDFYEYNTKLYGPTWTYAYICWQQKGEPRNPFFHDVRVRQAMSYAFDMERWLNDINFGLYRQGAGPFHPDSPWGSPDMELIERDTDYAQELLEDAGWYEDSNGDGTLDKEIDGKRVEFEFAFLCPSTGTAKDCAVILQQNLKQIGIKMNIKQIEWATFQQMTFEHKFEASSAAWGTGADPDTNRNLWSTAAYKSGRNYGGYSNEDVDELFEQGRREFDFEKRREIYQEINRIVYEEQPYTFLNHRSELWAFNKDLRGYNFSPRDPFGYFMGVLSIWKVKK